jgi:hypothetical protein
VVLKRSTGLSEFISTEIVIVSFLEVLGRVQRRHCAVACVLTHPWVWGEVASRKGQGLWTRACWAAYVHGFYFFDTRWFQNGEPVCILRKSISVYFFALFLTINTAILKPFHV